MTKQTYYKKGNFHKVVSHAKKRKDIVLDSQTLASERIRRGLEDTITNRGWWVAECTAHFPNEGLVLLVSSQANVLFPNSNEVTKLHRELYEKNVPGDGKLYGFQLNHDRNVPQRLIKYGKTWSEIYIALAEKSGNADPDKADILTLQESDMEILPYNKGLGINVLIKDFDKNPISRFLFRQDAKKYAEWLKTATGSKKISLKLERAKKYKITEPFACSLWCDGVYLPTSGFFGEIQAGFGDFDDTGQALSCDYHGGAVVSTSKSPLLEKRKKIPMEETFGRYIKLQMKRGNNVSHLDGETVFVADLDPNLKSIRISNNEHDTGFFDTLPLPMNYIKAYEIIKRE